MPKKLRPPYLVELDKITALEARTLTETNKKFLRARAGSLTKEQKKKFREVLETQSITEVKPENRIDEFPGVTESKRIARGAKRKADQAKKDAVVVKEKQLEADKEVTKNKIYEAEVKLKEDKEKNETLDQKIKRLKKEVVSAQVDAKAKEDKKKK